MSSAEAVEYGLIDKVIDMPRAPHRSVLRSMARGRGQRSGAVGGRGRPPRNVPQAPLGLPVPLPVARAATVWIK